MINLYRRYSLIKKANLDNSIINISSATKVYSTNTSSISIVNGVFQFGYSFGTDYPSEQGALIKLGQNSKIIVRGKVLIGPGSSIVVHDNGTLVFEGENAIAHNNKIYCHTNITFGSGTCTSWNCSFMDFDGHHFNRLDGQNKDYQKPLIIGRKVGIQQNVIIPKGVSVGDHSIISAGTILRQDIPENCLVHSNSEIRIKHGYQSGL